MHNYLLPRDCPRVTFYAAADGDPADVAGLLAVDHRPSRGHRSAGSTPWALPSCGYTNFAQSFELVDPVAATYAAAGRSAGEPGATFELRRPSLWPSSFFFGGNARAM